MKIREIQKAIISLPVPIVACVRNLASYRFLTAPQATEDLTKPGPKRLISFEALDRPIDNSCHDWRELIYGHFIGISNTM